MYLVSEICKILNVKDCERTNLNQLVVKDIIVDSRKLLNPSDTMFVALISERNNGHDFISELYFKNVRIFLVNNLFVECNDMMDAVFIRVNNTLEAFQRLVSWHRSKFNIPVIGITGSNGKTIVKEWLYQLLSSNYKTVRSPKSYNSQIGVPLSVWQMTAENELAVFEAGISQTGEMEKLQKIIKPTIGIFTNIGAAHDENFLSLEQKVGEKLNLFTSAEVLIYCSDYHLITERIFKSGINKKVKIFSWGLKNNPDLKILKIEKIIDGSKIIATYQNSEITIQIPFNDDASVENAIHCWALMLVLNISNSDIESKMQNLSRVAMRLELKAGINQCSIVDDSYNSDINSLRIALDFMSHQKNHHKNTVILSDMLQTGRNDEDLYREIGEMLESRKIQQFIGIGKVLSRHSFCFPMKSYFFNYTIDFLNQFDFSLFTNELILIKGARAFEFEKVSRVLQQKSHQTTLEVNLDAIIHNYNFYRKQLQPNTKMMAMVKAFSYGSGSSEIANVLQFHHVDYLGVAYVDEGVDLRRSGITLPIMVMHPEPESFDNIIKYDLEPEISNFKMFDMLEDTINTFDIPKNVKIHIKVDTGMHRLGFCEQDVDTLLHRLNSLQCHIEVKSVFSHLAVSDDPSEDAFSQLQISRLKSVSSELMKFLNYPIMVHILNSSGIVRFKDAQFDMVRLGIGLYGIPTTPFEKNELQNVCTLKTTISQIKSLSEGETVGYGRKWTAQKESKIAVLPIGYADGLLRKYGFGVGKVFVNNSFAPIIGAICMDMCMIDVSGLTVHEGDEVIIFGDVISVSDVAKAMDTIPYEVLTSISQRVKRVYVKE